MADARQETLLVVEWGSDDFHARVAELEKQGYAALRETYKILADTDPETGEIRHRHSIQMTRPQPD